jgi:hypothetical protein
MQVHFKNLVIRLIVVVRGHFKSGSTIAGPHPTYILLEASTALSYDFQSDVSKSNEKNLLDPPPTTPD